MSSIWHGSNSGETKYASSITLGPNDNAYVLYGYGGDDKLYGSNIKDYLHGGSGDDLLNGYNGNDFITGDSGDDDLYGGSGNDRLHGGSGNDTIFADSGDDYLYGGTGNDTYVLDFADTGEDKINDDLTTTNQTGNGGGLDAIVIRDTWIWNIGLQKDGDDLKLGQANDLNDGGSFSGVIIEDYFSSSNTGNNVIEDLIAPTLDENGVQIYTSISLVNFVDNLFV